MTNPKLALRYRIIGADCSRDAARIEGAARDAGAQEVRVSVVTFIMTFEASPERVAEIERAVAATGFGVERINEEGNETPAHQTPAYRRALWIVVALNVGYGVVEMAGGFLSGSQALKADALDFIGDGLITLLGVLAIGWSVVWRAVGPDTGGLSRTPRRRRARDDGLSVHRPGYTRCWADGGFWCGCIDCQCVGGAATASPPPRRREYARGLAILAQRRNRERSSGGRGRSSCMVGNRMARLGRGIRHRWAVPSLILEHRQ